MKNMILASVLFLSLAFTANGQSQQYAGAMQNGLTMIDSVKSQQDYLDNASYFDRIAISEKTQWLPFYYSAYCRTIAAFMEKDKERIDPILDQAQASLDEAMKISENNSELYAIQGMLYQARIQVSFTRGMKYSQLAGEAIEKAIALNPSNPRAQYLKGQNIYYTPAMFGGGAEKALPYYQKAQELFNQQPQAEKKGIDPSWGKRAADKMVAVCSTKS